MVAMSREAISLTEANQTLQEELAEAKRMGQTGVEDLRSEFTRRLATAEKKLQAVVKVRVQNVECAGAQASIHVSGSSDGDSECKTNPFSLPHWFVCT